MSKSTDSVAKIRDLPADELTSALNDVRDELFRLRLGMQTNQVSSTAAAGTKRREIARIMTIMQARKLGLETAGEKPAAKSAKKTAKSANKAVAPKAKAVDKATAKPSTKKSTKAKAE